MFKNIKVSTGLAIPLGFSLQEKQANFAIFSSSATQVTLLLFNGIKKKEVPLQKTGEIWHIAIENLPETTTYAFQVEGPFDVKEGLVYNKDLILADPYSKAPCSATEWGQGLQSTKSKCNKPSAFDWQGVLPPLIPKQDLIIYEMHVRGFTQHSSSLVQHQGTFLGIIEKIPYLKKLGVNVVELMPIFEFDETQAKENVNYWGYNPLYFFAPMRRFAIEDPVLEFKTLVRELHKNGIEIWLDVVYNHTGEGNDPAHAINFLGIDNPVYYMIDENGNHLNFSGCSNTFNVNHPVVTRLILDSLHYWVAEMKIDGFRFDLASIFTRNCDQGHPIEKPPILQVIAADPILKEVKLIAEPWDAGGLYQLGHFAHLGNWSEWNGFFRDQCRKFIKGTDGCSGEFAKAICGSQFLYGSSSPLNSINFITAHDGFTLRDLVSYQEKRNFKNGEMNQDGCNHNDSWNCGAEGDSKDPLILELRERQMRNFFLALFLSQGIPMLTMGDEYGHTSYGNNNPYVQDNEISWFLWDTLKKQKSIFDFVSSLIHFRKNHSMFHRPDFIKDNEIEWHGTEPLKANWEGSNRFVAFTLKGDVPLYVAFNADFSSKTVTLPEGICWKEIVKTENNWNHHNLRDPEKGKVISSIELISHSAFVAKGSSLKENPLIC